MKSVHFRKLYQRMPEDGYGFSPEAIVIYGKRPHTCETKVLSYEEAKIKGVRIEEVVIQYRCMLLIDLWLVVLRFDWYSEAK